MKGFVALSTVLIITAVMLATLGTVTYLAIGEAQSSLALSQGEANLGLVEGCVEETLQKIHDNPAFSATSITRPSGTGNCTIFYNPGGGGPTNWDITVGATPTDYQRKVRVIFTRSSSAITMTSWQEI